MSNQQWHDDQNVGARIDAAPQSVSSAKEQIAAERKRCLDWAKWYRQHGEGDIRGLITAIATGSYVSDEADDDGA
jgi:hypothetical protein